MSPHQYHHSSAKLKSGILERIGVLELSLPTGGAAAAAAAAAALLTDGNDTTHNPLPVDIFMVLCSDATATLGSTPQHGNTHMGVVAAWFKFTSQFQY